MHDSDTPSPVSNLATIDHSKRLAVVQEAASVSAGIQAIANGCIQEGHATVEAMEQIYFLARSLCRGLNQLGVHLVETSPT